ncbi:MAG: FAD-binding oxidoreductase [Pseudomonadota bacterium]
MAQRDCESWGRLPHLRNAARQVHPLTPHVLGADGHRSPASPAPASPTSALVYGNGRSYGDTCLNPGGTLYRGRAAARLLAFDTATGLITAEAGMTLATLLAITVPQGWFPPVVPGTTFVTLGGAVANDIHGKNHVTHGTFGCHVRALTLARSDGTTRTCSTQAHAELFAATIAGMGLTGAIMDVTLQLMRVPGPFIAERSQRFDTLDEFAALCLEADRLHAYSVAWIDTMARGHATGRGIMMVGDHAAAPAVPGGVDGNGNNDGNRDGDGLTGANPPSEMPSGSRVLTPRLSVPFAPPVSLINRLTLRPMTAAYFHRHPPEPRLRRVPYHGFFFPLDGIGRWNRIYGPHGFYQHQCLIPLDRAGSEHAAMLDALDHVRALIAITQDAGEGSFLTVLKRFGAYTSPGLMSFPREGLTLTMDFANRGARTLAMLERLDACVRETGGRICLYKDARMSRETFAHGYPNAIRFAEQIDPGFSSQQWRRLTGEGADKPARGRPVHA